MAAIIGKYRQIPDAKPEDVLFYCLVLPTVASAEIGKQFILDSQKPSKDLFFNFSTEERTVVFQESLAEFRKKIGDTKIYDGVIEFVQQLIIGDEYDCPGEADANIATTDLIFL